MKRKITTNNCQAKNLPDVMSPEEASVVIGVNKATIRRWAAEGIIPAKKRGPKLWAIPKWAVMEYIERTAYAGRAI